MTDQEIWSVFLKVARGIKGFREEGMAPATELRDEARHGLDSLGRVELSLGIEEAFGIRIQDEEFEALKTLGDIEALVQRKLHNGGGKGQ